MLDTVVSGKQCSKCREVKSIKAFRMKKGRKKPMCRCKACEANYSNDWYRRNKEQRRAKAKEYYIANKSRFSTYTRKWRKDNIERARRLEVDGQRKRKYGISRDKYEEMLEQSGGLCAICHESFGDDYPNIDHDHKTGQVRELLCRRCNHGLGNFRDNIDFLESSIAYLKKHKEVQQ